MHGYGEIDSGVIEVSSIANLSLSIVGKAMSCIAVRIAVLLVLLAPAFASGQEAAVPVDRFVNLALDCVHQEYPNKIAHVMSGDEDLGPPRELTPVFFGCFDWHSPAHGH